MRRLNSSGNVVRKKSPRLVDVRARRVAMRIWEEHFMPAKDFSGQDFIKDAQDKNKGS